MKFDINVAKKVATNAMKDFEIPGQHGVLLISSIPEGYGNTLSDIDVLLIDKHDNPLLSTRQMTYVDGMRCEIFLMTTKELLEIAARINAIEDVNDVEDENELKRDLKLYHNVVTGLPVAHSNIVEGARAHFHRAHLSQIASAYDRRELRRMYNKTLLASRLQLNDQTKMLASRTLRCAMSLCAAVHDETNRTDKFQVAKLSRIESVENLDEIVDFLSSTDLQSDVKAYFDSAVSLISGLGEMPESSPCQITFTQPLTTLSVWDRLYIKADDRLLLVRYDLDGAVNSLLDITFPTELNELDAEQLLLISELFKIGLIEARWPELDISYSHDAGRHVSSTPYQVICNGILVDEDNTGQALLDLNTTAELLVGAGLEIGFEGMKYSNYQEDAIGALRYKRWPEVETGLKGMVLALCTGALASTGRVPIPDEEWRLVVLAQFKEYEDMATSAKRALKMEVRDDETALNMFMAVKELDEFLPDEVFGDLAYACESGLSLWNAVQTLVNWGDAAMRLDLPLMPDEYNAAASISALRENAMSPYMKEAAMERLSNWSRTDNFIREVELLAS